MNVLALVRHVSYAISCGEINKCLGQTLSQLKYQNIEIHLNIKMLSDINLFAGVTLSYVIALPCVMKRRSSLTPESERFLML